MSDESTRPQQADNGDRGDRGAPRMDKDSMGEGGPRFKSKRRRKVSYLTINKIDTVDYKEINILRRFLNDRGKILPSRQSGNTAKQQRMIASAIRKAREMALLPFVVTEMGTDRREYAPRRERSFDRGPRDGGGRYEGPRQDREPREAAPAADAAPAAEAPVVEAPIVKAPVVEAPVVEAPVAEAPVAEAAAKE